MRTGLEYAIIQRMPVRGLGLWSGEDDTVGLVEALASFAAYRDEGAYHTPWGDYDLRPALGVVFCGASLPAVDAAAAQAFGSDPAELEYLQRAEARLGSWRPGLQALVAEEWRAGLSAAGH